MIAVELPRQPPTLTDGTVTLTEMSMDDAEQRGSIVDCWMASIAAGDPGEPAYEWRAPSS